MLDSKQQTNVALFPLCDARRVLIDVLLDTSDSPGTRGDALVFAWRLELPENMSVAKAANAVLSVAMSQPRRRWSRLQRLILRELMVLAGREGVTYRKTELPKRNLSSQATRAMQTPGPKPVHLTGASRVERRTGARVNKSFNPWAESNSEQSANRQTSTHRKSPGVEAGGQKSPVKTQPNAPKESKEWWRLVGKPEDYPDNTPPRGSNETSGQRKTRTRRVNRDRSNRGPSR